jgi:hypothetical protein
MRKDVTSTTQRIVCALNAYRCGVVPSDVFVLGSSLFWGFDLRA